MKKCPNAYSHLVSILLNFFSTNEKLKSIRWLILLQVFLTIGSKALRNIANIAGVNPIPKNGTVMATTAKLGIA